MNTSGATSAAPGIGRCWCRRSVRSGGPPPRHLLYGGVSGQERPRPGSSTVPSLRHPTQGRGTRSGRQASPSLPPPPVLDVPFRATCRSTVLQSAVDMWLPAQHDTGAGGMLAHQNAEADRLASEAADRSQPIELPLRPLLSGQVVGVATGAFCPSLSKACAALYDAAVSAKISTAFPAGDHLWSARAYAKLVLSRALRAARVLPSGSQPRGEPPGPGRDHMPPL